MKEKTHWGVGGVGFFIVLWHSVEELHCDKYNHFVKVSSTRRPSSLHTLVLFLHDPSNVTASSSQLLPPRKAARLGCHNLKNKMDRVDGTDHYRGAILKVATSQALVMISANLDQVLVHRYSSLSSIPTLMHGLS